PCKRRISADCLLEASFDGGTRLGGANAGIEAAAQLHDAAGGHRGCPFAAVDLAEIESDWMVQVRKGRIAIVRLIPLRFKRLQSVPQFERGFDGVDALRGVEHMRRLAENLD